MKKEKLQLESDLYTYLYKWEVKNPKAVMQLVHGSKEHIERYVDLIKHLNENGISVIGIDLRGHGVSAKEQNTFGHMGDDGYEAVVDDIEIVSQIIKEQYPGVPYTIYGHSMGSFIVREHSIRYGSDKYILSGTNEQPSFVSKFGIAVAKMTILFKGKKKVNKFIDGMSYKAFGKKFKGQSHLAWLSNDEQAWEKYKKDAKSTKTMTNETFVAMLKWLDNISKNKSYKNISANKILIISGEKDPVGQMSKGPKKVYNKLIKHGLNADIIIYKDGRHEIHNDLNKKKTYEDITSFIKD